MTTLYFVVDEGNGNMVTKGFFGKRFFENKSEAKELAEQRRNSVALDESPDYGFTVYKAEPVE